MDEILWCDHLNNTSSVGLSLGTVYLVCNSNFCMRVNIQMKHPSWYHFTHRGRTLQTKFTTFFQEPTLTTTCRARVKSKTSYFKRTHHEFWLGNTMAILSKNTSYVHLS